MLCYFLLMRQLIFPDLFKFKSCNPVQNYCMHLFWMNAIINETYMDKLYICRITHFCSCISLNSFNKYWKTLFYWNIAGSPAGVLLKSEPVLEWCLSEELLTSSWKMSFWEHILTSKPIKLIIITNTINLFRTTGIYVMWNGQCWLTSRPCMLHCVK